jgi:Chalcone isomerase-like
MQRKYTTYLIAVCATFYWAGGLFASQNMDGTPREVAALPNARSVGAAQFKVWGFKVYDARLWASQDFKAEDYAQRSFALEINYLRSFDNGAVAERSIQEMRGIGKFSEAQAAQWLAQMQRIFPDIANGDRLVGMHKPGVGAAFSFNGKSVGEIADPEFARLFFGIWLSPKTSAPQLRRELLGLDTAKP